MSKVINISSNGIKQAIDDLVNENELLQDKVYKLEEENKRLKEELKYTIPIVEHNKTITKHLKEKERLNNIINDLLNRQNEALRYIGNHLSLDSRYKHGNGDEKLTLVRNILNKHIKELKGSDKE